MNPITSDRNPTQQLSPLLFATHFFVSQNLHSVTIKKIKLKKEKKNENKFVQLKLKNDVVVNNGHGGGCGVVVAGDVDGDEVESDVAEGAEAREGMGGGGFRPLSLGGTEGRGVSQGRDWERATVGEQGLEDSTGLQSH